MAGHKEDAIGHLRVAFERRPSLRDVAKEDTDLDPLRDEPAFRELVGYEPNAATAARSYSQPRYGPAPRFSRPRAMISRWISLVPSQIRSTRSSR